MTKITLLRTKDTFVTTWSISKIYDYLIDDKFVLIPLLGKDELLLSVNEPVRLEEE